MNLRNILIHSTWMFLLIFRLNAYNFHFFIADHSVRENYPRQSSYSVIGSPRSTPGYRAMNGGSGSVRQIKGPSLSTCGEYPDDWEIIVDTWYNN